MSTNIKQVVDFYDDYTTRQKKIGVNSRHRTIIKKLKQAGLQPNSKVLEIGCGIGTASGLVANFVSNGLLVGVDISSKSIEIAKHTFASRNNVEFLVSDMSSFTYKTKFDFVLMPDVIEHIPIEQHLNLFKVIRENTHENSVVAINLPNPYMLEWVRKYKPEQMQIIDQSIYTDLLVQNIYPNGFYIHSLESYSLTTVESDYQWIILKPRKVLENVHYKSNIDKALLSAKLRLKL